MANTLRAGRITGDPLKGLCDRVCISVDRIYDGCRETVNDHVYLLPLSGVPPQAVPPFTFTEAASYGNATVENAEVTAGVPLSRVTLDIAIPIVVTFTDANGDAFTATTTLRLHREVGLRVPLDSLQTYRIEAFAAFLSRIGNFVGTDSVSVEGCYTLVIKVIVPTDLLVPSYGTCVYPACTDCNDAARCEAFLTTPLFPPI